jgi:hypothetical protein
MLRKRSSFCSPSVPESVAPWPLWAVGYSGRLGAESSSDDSSEELAICWGAGRAVLVELFCRVVAGGFVCCGCGVKWRTSSGGRPELCDSTGEARCCNWAEAPSDGCCDRRA